MKLTLSLFAAFCVLLGIASSHPPSKGYGEVCGADLHVFFLWIPRFWLYNINCRKTRWLEWKLGPPARSTIFSNAKKRSIVSSSSSSCCQSCLWQIFRSVNSLSWGFGRRYLLRCFLISSKADLSSLVVEFLFLCRGNERLRPPRHFGRDHHLHQRHSDGWCYQKRVWWWNHLDSFWIA